MTENYYYIYCIAQDGPEGAAEGVAGHLGAEVLGIRYKDLTAYVSRTGLTHLEATYENLRCHENVVSSLMAGCELLPVCFSTICASHGDVVKMLSRYYGQLKENLERVSGKFELGVKVLYRLDGPEDGPPPPAPDMTPKAYMLRRYEGYLIAKKQSDALFGRIMEFHGRLSALSADVRYTRPMKNSLVFNASYLVPKSGKDAFDSAVGEIVAQYPEFRLLYSGPWPAYHFITIEQMGDDLEQHSGC